jgi:thiol-disulfide isomerase/thioredoxin
MLRRRFLSCGLLGGTVAAGLLPAVPGLAQVAGAAPAFAGLDMWLNTEAPLTIASLRGKVVLVNFWTYSCINCRRTVPYLNRWQATYGADGLQVIGIHTPEFRFERVRPNVEAAVQELGIHYPVGQDNDFQTWDAWGNRAWPSFYLLDREGRTVLVREGEDHAAEIESAIRALLGVANGDAAKHPGDDPDLSRIGTPEIYFGSLHPTPQDRAQNPRSGEAVYTFATSQRPAMNRYILDGTWAREQEPLVLRSAHGGLRLRFSAAKLHLVASAPEPAALTVTIDGGDAHVVEVSRPTLYTLFDGDTYREHLLDLQTNRPGLSLFSATFG